jgi:hypothetical protein
VKSCPSASLVTTNPAWTGLGLKTCFLGERRRLTAWILPLHCTVMCFLASKVIWHTSRVLYRFIHTFCIFHTERRNMVLTPLGCILDVLVSALDQETGYLGGRGGGWLWLYRRSCWITIRSLPSDSLSVHYSSVTPYSTLHILNHWHRH